MAKILVIQGPNLNLLGTREPEIYGHTTLDDIHQMLTSMAADNGHQLESMQSNAENEIIERVHAARDDVDFILINPGAFTHTSVAIRDAIAGVGIPFIEIHISNVYQREPFRHKSYFSDLARAVICGFGINGYRFALTQAMEILDNPAGN
jgi:3-dehydroquinate dehydratase-2